MVKPADAIAAAAASLFRLRPARRLLLAGALIAASLPALPAWAQSCDRSGCGFATCATPATPVTSGFWGEIQPADASFTACGQTGPLFCRDSTSFSDSVDAYSAFPWFMAVDTQNGFVMAALAYGLEVWDARTTPATPSPLGQVSVSNFPVGPSNPEIKLPLQHVATAPGTDTSAAVAGLSGLGVTIIDLTNKNLPKVAYQSYLKEGNQVYAATLSGRQYAFLAASQGSPSGGLYVYDMTKALTFDHCAESVPATGSTVQCPGVYLGRIGTRDGVSYVSGVGNYLVLSSGAGSGFEIWDVTTPTNAILRLSAQPAASTYGVAMWQQNGTYYLALRTDNSAQFYDVSCIQTGCSGLGGPLATRTLDTGTPNFYVTYSLSGTTPFVYFGSDDACQGGSQREWLYDVTNPSSPRDVSPSNYWGWYYRGNATGFNYIMPRSGRFVGNYFYRAAQSILDIHKWNQGANPTPSIFVSGPSTGNPGQTLTYSASGAICSPSASGWSWTASGGATISGNTTSNSVQVTWPNAGQQDVTAMNSSCGIATGLENVTIASSNGSNLTANFTYTPQAPNPGQPVSFDASSSTGNPTQFSWTFGDGTGGSGVTTSHTYAKAGQYDLTLQVSAPGTGAGCIGGTCSAQTTRVIAVGQPPAPDATFTTSAPCVNQFGFNQCTASVGQTVSFTASDSGPFTYTWDFGDGTKATGQSVTHVWTQPSQLLTMELAVSNGQQTAFQTMLFTINAASTSLQLVNGRFVVDVTWTTSNGQSGPGQAVDLTSDTGYFWFFSSANIEMVIKVLNGCSINNRYWVFAGGLTNVQVAITVTDTKTNAVTHYTNNQGVQFSPIQDTNAFATCP